jgi:hypothetical protein
MRRNNAWLTGLVFALGLALAGVIVVMISPRPEGFPSPADMQAEYRAAINKLKFPPGYQPKATDPAAAQNDGVFVAGAGAVDAGNAWFCAWVFEWDKYRSSDPVRASGALDTLAGSYPNGPFWQSLARADGSGLKDEIDQAHLGDPRAMESQIDAFGCSR